jgi:hypothetical protein
LAVWKLALKIKESAVCAAIEIERPESMREAHDDRSTALVRDLNSRTRLQKRSRRVRKEREREGCGQELRDRNDPTSKAGE